MQGMLQKQALQTGAAVVGRRKSLRKFLIFKAV